MGLFDRFRVRHEAAWPRTMGHAEPTRLDVGLVTQGGGDLAESMGDFGLRLGHGIEANLVGSALSIFEAWLRVWAGSDGACRDEIAKALDLRGDEAGARAALEAITRVVVGDADDATVSSANAIWVRPGLTIHGAFESRWGGATRELDFTDARRAADTVNRWVEGCTHGMIRDVLEPAQIHRDLAVILANAIYLKAKWRKPFEPSGTVPHPFQTLGGEAAEVPMMSDVGSYACVATADFDLLLKPYVLDTLDFVLLLPREGRFRIVRDQLRFATVRRAIAATAPVRTWLRLPRFRSASAPDVDGCLRARGATAIYDPRTSDLSRFSPAARAPGRELFVSQTIHRARIDVDEQGTEAAAATLVLPELGSALPSVLPYELTADRPFLYFVVERSTGVPLFSGQVVDPR